MFLKTTINFLFVLFLYASPSFAQDSPQLLNSTIESVKIHLQGAEIIRTTSINLPAGTHNLAFTDLSPNLIASTIQLTGDEGLQFLSITNRTNFLKEKNNNSPEIVKLKDSLATSQIDLQDLNDQLSAYTKEKELLSKNQKITSNTTMTDMDALIKAGEIYRSRLTQINRSVSSLSRQQKEKNKAVKRLQQQLRERNYRGRALSEVYVSIKTQRASTAKLVLRYVVKGAGWSPIYDLKVSELDQPIQLKYRSLAFNNTGVDWNDVKITLSTADALQSATQPILSKWTLDQDSGFESEKLGEVKSRPELLQSNITEKSKNTFLHDLNPDLATANSNIRFEETEIMEFSAEFDIEELYTIPADSKPYSIDITTHQLNSSYQHYAIPKMDNDAFLLAQITGWEDYNLIAGPANIYFAQSFIGQSELNPINFNDTLDLSLGRDSKILVKREKLKEFTKKQFLGGNKKMTVAYEITVKNNRNQNVAFNLLDQVPVSITKDIEVDVKEVSKASLNEATGKLEWKFNLAPGASKKVRFSYTIKYPKNRRIRLERTRNMITPRYF